MREFINSSDEEFKEKLNKFLEEEEKKEVPEDPEEDEEVEDKEKEEDEDKDELCEESVLNFYKAICPKNHESLFVFTAGEDKNSQAENLQRNKKFRRTLEVLLKRLSVPPKILKVKGLYDSNAPENPVKVRNDFFVLKYDDTHFPQINKIVKMALSMFGIDNYFVAKNGQCFTYGTGHGETKEGKNDPRPMNAREFSAAFTKVKGRPFQFKILAETYEDPVISEDSKEWKEAEAKIKTCQKKVEGVFKGIEEIAPKTVSIYFGSSFDSDYSDEVVFKTICDDSKTISKYGYGSQIFEALYLYNGKNHHGYKWSIVVKYDAQRSMASVEVFFPKSGSTVMTDLFTEKLREVIEIVEKEFGKKLMAGEGIKHASFSANQHFSKNYFSAEW